MSRTGIIILFSLVFVFPARGQESDSSSGKKMEKPAESRMDRVRKEVATVFSEQGRVLFQYARALGEDGKDEHALEKYREFLVLYPEHELRFHAFYESARLLKKMGNVKAAALHYLDAYREDFRSTRGAGAYLEAARLFLQVGETERAKNILLELITVFPYSKIAEKAKLEVKSAGLEISDSQALDFSTGDRYNNQDIQDSDRSNADIHVIERGAFYKGLTNTREKNL